LKYRQGERLVKDVPAIALQLGEASN
jgi:hypothetical protein